MSVFRYILIRSKPAHRAPLVDIVLLMDFCGGQVSSWGSNVVIDRDLDAPDGYLDLMGIGFLWSKFRYHADMGGGLVGGYVASVDGEQCVRYFDVFPTLH